MSKLQQIPRAQELLAKVLAVFPHISCREVRYIDIGWDHEVIIIDDALVFRFPDDAEYTKKLRDEIAFLTELLPYISCNIPEYTLIAPDSDFAGYKIVPGDVLLPDVFNSLSQGDQKSLQFQLAEFLSRMHTLTKEDLPASYSFIDASFMHDEHIEVTRKAHKYLPDVLTADEMKVVNNILHAVDELLTEKLSEVVIHGDVYSQHLLWDRSARKLGIIDFSDMIIGDPAIDFAELYEYGDGFVRDVYQQYSGPKDNGFLDRAWIYQCWTAVYMLTDYFDYKKTSFEIARETFDRVRQTARNPIVV